MTVETPAAHTAPDIAYFQIFRVYHTPTKLGATHSLFNNARQRIPLTIEVLARDHLGRKVPLSTDDLASMRLVEVDSSGNPVGTPVPHDVPYQALSGWSTYHNAGEYVYDESVIDQTAPFVHEENSVVSKATTASDTIRIWVATNDAQTRTFAVLFSDTLSTHHESLPGRIRLRPRTLSKYQVSFEIDEQLVYQSGSGNNWSRAYNNYIRASYRGQKLALKYIYMPGIWWDRGDEWSTELSFCVAGHAGESMINKYKFRLPDTLTTANSPWDSWPTLDWLMPADAIPQPRPDEVVVLMRLIPSHLVFFQGDQRAEDTLSFDGDITDIHGNVHPIRFRYHGKYDSQPRRALKIIKL
ncbi:hypothetical protein [Pseudomonas guariconensis]|uniref:hypothetical protein n=1 Tax=Pseudomonas guariconensis TaxID=1288410 RepID=UPI0018A8D4A9|nr:hypothetical protein [Pseudomonas guariconensis]MBF8720562.1 hypothetical protein [Pseudomonas guariconensis]